MFLSAAPLLGAEDLQLFSRGLSAGWDGRCDSALQEAVSRLADRAEPTGHVVLILDKVSRPSLPTPPICTAGWHSRYQSVAPGGATLSYRAK